MQKTPDPYGRFKPDELLLRDELAIDRTLLSNERTFLAYLRTAVALVLAGVTFIHFANHSWLETLGIFCVPVGVVILVLSYIRYRQVRLSILALRKRFESEDKATQ